MAKINFGFNGIHLNIPDDYKVIKSLGDQKKGEIHFSDNSKTALICQWHKKSNPNILKLEEEHFNTNKRRKLIRKSELPQNILYYEYLDNEIHHCAALLKADQQGRTILYTFPSTKQLTQKEILNLIPDPKKMDALNRWKIYNVDFTLPASYIHAESELSSGMQYFKFYHNNDFLLQWTIGMAEQILQGQDISTWLQSFINSRFPKRYKVSLIEDRNNATYYMCKKRFRWKLNMFDLFFKRHKGIIKIVKIPELNQFCLALLLYKKDREKSHIEDIIFTNHAALSK